MFTERRTSPRAVYISNQSGAPYILSPRATEELTNATLSPSFVDAEHSDVASIDLALMNILLAYYYANRFGRLIVCFIRIFGQRREGLCRERTRQVSKNSIS